MSLLASLAAHERGQVTPTPAYHERRAVRFIIQIDSSGALLGCVDLGENERVSVVPKAQRSGATPKPYVLCDTADCVAAAVGKLDSPAKVQLKHQMFVDLLNTVHSGADAATQALLTPVVQFYQKHVAGLAQHADWLASAAGSTVAFQIDGDSRLLHEHQEIVKANQDLLRGRKTSGQRGVCLVCGVSGPLVDTLPGSLTKEHLGAGSSQMALLSANEPAYTRTGATGLGDAPLCEGCALLSIAAIQRLTCDRRSRRRLDSSSAVPSTAIWWVAASGAAPEFELFEIQDAANPAVVGAFLDQIGAGKFAALTDSDRFRSVRLAPGSGRVSVMDWLDVPLGKAVVNVAAWLSDIAIADGGDRPVFRPMWVLGKCLGRFNAKDSSYTARKQPDETLLWSACVHGSPLPASMLAAAVDRVRSLDWVGVDAQESRRVMLDRTAVIKLVLNRLPYGRGPRMEAELDVTSTDSAYLCGRLFATLESIQYLAQGEVGANITKRYFAGAMTTPALVFPGLVSAATSAHLPKARRDKGGAAVVQDKILSGIVSALPSGGFARNFTLEEQGRFIVGYHHQRSENFRRAAAAKACVDES